MFTGTNLFSTMKPDNLSWIRYNRNSTTDTAPYKLNNSEHSIGQMTSFYGVYSAFTSVELGFCVVGFVLNCLVIDTSNFIRRKTAGTKWMKLLAFWDNVALLGAFLRTGTREVFGMDSWVMTVIGCRLFAFLFWFGVTNASAHLACLACDRAFVIASPRKHYNVRWDQWIPKTSIGFTLLYCIIALPQLYEKENDGLLCKMKTDALKVYQALFPTFFTTFAHFALIFVASIVFVDKMRHRKREKGVQKSSKEKTEVENRQNDNGNNFKQH